MTWHVVGSCKHTVWGVNNTFPWFSFFSVAVTATPKILLRPCPEDEKIYGYVFLSLSSHFPWKCFTVLLFFPHFHFSHRYIKMYMRTEHTWKALSELWSAIQYLCLLLDSFWRTVYIGIERMSSMLHVSQHWMHLKHWWDDLNSGCLVLQELASA